MEEGKEVITVASLPYRVLVVGGGYEYIKLMHDMNFQGAKSPEDADIILFTGGEDVDPTWYGEKRLQVSFCNLDRDRREKVIFDYAVENKIPMVGICRGGQFLNVMNGGSMWQHVNNHATGNNHGIMVKGEKDEAPRHFLVTSTHHQMMRPAKSGKVLAIAVDANGNSLCTSRQSYEQLVEGNNSKKYPDVEVVWYDDTASLCFQPHPEFAGAPHDCKKYFAELLDIYVLTRA